MFAIGEFSRITGLSVKTLRFYHDKAILIPAEVDGSSGYRFYDGACVDRARVIVRLREIELTLDEIKDILDQHDDEADILQHLERHKHAIEAKIRRQRNVVRSLETIIAREREAKMAMDQASFEVQEKVLDTMLIAGVRMKGAYRDISQGFARIGKSMGRYICGKPLALYYDREYREEDADFEACMPVSKGKQVDGISVRELPGGRCVSLIHQGPYDELGRSYEKILAYVADQGLAAQSPSREVYLKGPGMIFKGNPRNYLTEIQLLV